MSSAPWIGAFTLVAVALVYDLLLAWIRRADESTWWYGYSCDLSHLVALAGFTTAFLLLGYAGPFALLAAFFFTLVAYGIDQFVSRILKWRPAWSLAFLVLMLAALVVAKRSDLARGLESMLELLFADPARRSV
ncbi:MAG: hypothetical protein HY698_07395 [Deltaproteobacteria bacterium]|nr:hypothetical protein [Deltaproteobacteria bacterium]